MPRNGSSASEMLDGLKSRLGFNRGKEDDYDDYGDFYDDSYDDSLDDDFDEYGDYGEYGYDGDEPAVGGYRPARAGSSRSGRYNRDSASNLVSIEDVKAQTRGPDRLQRDPLPDSRASYTSATGQTRNVIDNTAPAPSSPAHMAAQRRQSRSDGLDSLFEPSTSLYDPYEAYSSGASAGYAPSRSLTVLKPVAYGDVERVARAVKSGDVVVLAMRNTPDDLSKRILDFSFGVASALDASVECPGEKVFAIARGAALSPSEKTSLRNQGVL